MKLGLAVCVTLQLLVSSTGQAGTATANLTVTITQNTPPPPATFVANFSDVHQTMDGFGASNAWVGNLNAPTLDALYCINATDPGCGGPGIGLSLLRVGMDSSDGITQADTIPGGIVSGCTTNCPSQTSAAGAQARGAYLFATPWVVSDANQTPAANGIVSWVDAQSAAGVPIKAVTTGNEVDCCSSYPFPPGDTANFVKILGPMLHSRGVKLISPEVEDAANLQSYVSAIEGDSAANAQVDIFSTHQYGCGVTCTTLDGTRHVWETEASNFDGSANYDIYNAMINSQYWMYDAIVTVGYNAWNYWNSVCNCNAGVIGNVENGLGEVPKRYFAIGNWSRFVRPGWVRIGVSGSAGGFYGVAAFKNPTTGAFAMIAINDSGSDIPNVAFGIQNATISGSVTPYVTSGTAIGTIGTDGNLSVGSAASGVPSSLSPVGNVFAATIPYGVVTFVGTAH